MEEYERLEKNICNFDRYLKQTNDLLKDSYRWKEMAKYCDNSTIAEKYKNVSNTLYELFMEEHNRIGQMFKE